MVMLHHLATQNLLRAELTVLSEKDGQLDSTHRQYTLILDNQVIRIVKVIQLNDIESSSLKKTAAQ